MRRFAGTMGGTIGLLLLAFASAVRAQTPAPVEAAPASPVTAPSAEPATGSPAPVAETSTAPNTSPRVHTISSPGDCAGPLAREGFYLRMAGGLGVVSVAGDGPRGDVSMTGGGAVTSIAIGGHLAAGVVLAGTLQAANITNTMGGGPFSNATVTSDGVSSPASGKVAATFAQIGALVDWYPNRAGNWHAGLSAGLGLASVINQADDSTLFGTSATGSLFGGYDWAIGPRWSLGVQALVSASTNASMKDKSDQGHTGYKLRSLSVGIGVSLLYF